MALFTLSDTCRHMYALADRLDNVEFYTRSAAHLSDVLEELPVYVLPDNQSGFWGLLTKIQPTSLSALPDYEAKWQDVRQRGFTPRDTSLPFVEVMSECNIHVVPMDCVLSHRIPVVNSRQTDRNLAKLFRERDISREQRAKRSSSKAHQSARRRTKARGNNRRRGSTRRHSQKERDQNDETCARTDSCVASNDQPNPEEKPDSSTSVLFQISSDSEESGIVSPRLEINEVVSD